MKTKAKEKRQSAFHCSKHAGSLLAESPALIHLALVRRLEVRYPLPYLNLLGVAPESLFGVRLCHVLNYLM